MYHCTLLWGEQIGHGRAKEKAMFIPLWPWRELRVTHTPPNNKTDWEGFAFAPQIAVTCGRGAQGCCCRSQGQLFVAISIIKEAQQSMLLSP